MTAKYKHVAITGVPGVGKTTLVQKIVERLQANGIPCSGFYTTEVRQAGRRTGFDIITLDGKSGVLSRVKPDSGGGQAPRVGQYVVDIPSFESLALPLLKPKGNSGILVLDEIGKMEVFSQRFVSEVREKLSSQYTLLVTIPVPKGKPIGLVEEIRNHKEFHVINLTRENRDQDSLLDNIVSILTK